MKEQSLCVLCKVNKQHNKGKSWGYRPTCKGCYKYKLNKEKETCEKCGFIPEHPCQLDIHHMDNNHFNNSFENLQVLCANCHRLETCNFL